tara:strand:+ start:6034 stop:6969 length:936 start_codon:yes stop_codon:yes gene_type:complete
MSDYRKIDAVNQSRLKKILVHPKLYMHQEEREEKSYFTFGQFVEDVLLMSPEEIDDKYIICDVDMPTDKVKEVVEALYAARGVADFDSIEATLVDEIRMEAGYQTKWKAETAYNKLKALGSDYLDFIASTGDRIIISQEDYDKAQSLAIMVESNPSMVKYLSKDNKFKHVVTFLYKGFNCKGEIDIVHIDHEAKTMRVVDIKTTSQFLGFKSSILRYRYDFQLAFYTIALMEECLPGYTVLDPQLLVLDSNTFFSPEVYTIPTNFDSFEVNGRTYKGVSDAFDLLAYHTTHDKWDHSMDYIEAGETHEFEI